MFGLPLPSLGVWAAGLAVVCSLTWGGVQNIRAASARSDLAAERAARAEEGRARVQAAFAETQRLIGVFAEHARNQQGIVHELSEARRLARTADDGRRVAVDGVRKLADELAATRDRLEAGPHAAGAGAGGDQCRAEHDLLRRGGQLLARGAGLAARGAGLVEGRDAEVRALKGTVQNDRILLVEPGRAKLPRAAGRSESSANPAANE